MILRAYGLPVLHDIGSLPMIAFTRSRRITIHDYPYDQSLGVIAFGGYRRITNPLTGLGSMLMLEGRCF